MVDVQTQISAVTRTLEHREVDGEPAVVQTLSQTYPSPVEDVWSAVTEPDRIARWFLPVSGDLRRGGRYQLEGNAGGEVLECEAPAEGSARYRITWEMMGAVSWVSVRLTDEGGSTRLVLEHSVRDTGEPSQFWDTYGPGATGVGWDGGLLGLAQHLGAIEGSLTPEEAEAWASTDEGRTFYRGTADAWSEADTASGTTPAVAARRADATYGFYTGTGG